MSGNAICKTCGRGKFSCRCSFVLLDLPHETPSAGPLIVREVIPGKFHRNHSATNDLLREIKDLIYTRTGVLSVAEVLGVMRCIEHDILREQA